MYKLYLGLTVICQSDHTNILITLSISFSCITLNTVLVLDWKTVEAKKFFFLPAIGLGQKINHDMSRYVMTSRFVTIRHDVTPRLTLCTLGSKKFRGTKTSKKSNCHELNHNWIFSRIEGLDNKTSKSCLYASLQHMNSETILIQLRQILNKAEHFMGFRSFFSFTRDKLCRKK